MSLDVETPSEKGPGTGLCANPWCQDAALPDDEFCGNCLLEVEAMLAELEPPDFWRPTGECQDC